MKYKDFKQIDENLMKKIVGGTQPEGSGCIAEGTPCGPNDSKKCSFDSSQQACVCGGTEDPACYGA